MSSSKKDRSEPVKLSKREMEVLTLAAKGKTYAQISALLKITEPTAKSHMGNASIKLGTINKTHTIAVAIMRGLIQILGDE